MVTFEKKLSPGSEMNIWTLLRTCVEVWAAEPWSWSCPKYSICVYFGTWHQKLNLHLCKTFWVILLGIKSQFTITVLVYFNTPLELKNNFSDGFRWFEFQWGILRAELQIQFYLVKSRRPKGKFQICKTFSDGFRCFEFEGGGRVLK